MRSATQTLMMARRGSMQSAPIAPVKVMRRWRAARPATEREKLSCAPSNYNGGFKPRQETGHIDFMPIRELKDQIAKLPEQPGVYLYFNAAGETIYVRERRGRPARPGPELSWKHTAAEPRPMPCSRNRSPRGHRHRFGRRARALENNLIKQRNPALQRPAARRQDLSLPAADDHGDGAAAAGRAARRARRQRLRGSVHARGIGPTNDVARASGVRDPLVQRDDHRQRARPCLRTTSSAASRRAWRRSARAEHTTRRGRASRTPARGRARGVG